LDREGRGMNDGKGRDGRFRHSAWVVNIWNLRMGELDGWTYELSSIFIFIFCMSEKLGASHAIVVDDPGVV